MKLRAPQSIILSEIIFEDLKNSKQKVPIIWTKSKFATSYNIQLADNPKFKNAIKTNIIKNTYMPTLEFNKNYYWKVASIDNNKKLISDFSRSYPLRLKNITSLVAPNKFSPINNKKFFYKSNYKILPIHLSWNTVDNAEKYVLEISLSTNFKDILLKRSHLKANEFSISPEKFMDNKLFWRVRAVKNSISSKWSKTQILSILKESALNENKIALLRPNGLDSSSSGISISSSFKNKNITKGKKYIFPRGEKPPNIDLEWRYVEHARNYVLEVAADKKFTGLLIQQVIPRNFYSLDPSEFIGQKIYWRVRALRGNKTSKWSIYSSMQLQRVDEI